MLGFDKQSSKRTAAPAAGTVAKAWPRQLLPGPAPSPLSSVATKLAEVLQPLAHGGPIDLDRVAQHVRPDPGSAAAPASDIEPMPGPAGPGIKHLRHYVAVVTSKPVASPEGHLEGHLPALLTASKTPHSDAAAHRLFQLANVEHSPPIQQIEAGLSSYGLKQDWSLQLHLRLALPRRHSLCAS